MAARCERFDDNLGLFGSSNVSGTNYQVECELCGTVHNTGCDPEEPNKEGVYIRTAQFVDLQICDCCFDRVESYFLDNMGDIVLWMIEIIENDPEQLRVHLNDLIKLKQAINRHVKKDE